MAHQSNPFALIRLCYEGFRYTWLRYLQLLLVVLAVGVATIIVAVVGVIVNPLLGLIAPVGVVIAAFVYLAPSFYRLTLATARHQSISLREVLTGGWGLAWRFVWSQALAGLVTVTGLILFIVPGIFCLAWFALVPYVVVHENLSGVAALERSKALAGRRLRDMWGAIGLSSATSLFDLVPVIGPLIGLGFTIILLPVVAVRYVQLLELERQGELRTAPVSPWNYLVIGLALAGLGVSGWESVARSAVPAPTPVHRSP